MERDKTEKGSAINLAWTFGLNASPSTGVSDLSDGHRKVVFYAAAHTAVLFDYANSRQHLLQGHSDTISAACTSPDRRWAATADAGTDPLLIVWDTLPHLSAPTSATVANVNSAYGLPVRVVFNPNGGRGVTAMEFTSDASHVYTLSARPNKNGKQTVSIWDWTDESEEPMVEAEIDAEDWQNVVRISPDDGGVFMTNGRDSVSFFVWDKAAKSVQQFHPETNIKEFHHTPPHFLRSTFLPSTPSALTTTTDGELVVWTDRLLSDLTEPLQRGVKSALKFVRVWGKGTPVGAVEVVGGKYVVCGSEDGTVKVLDFQLRLLSWFEKLHSGPIVSLSFANQITADGGQAELVSANPTLPQFAALTSTSRIVLVAATERSLAPSSAPISMQGEWKSGQVVKPRKEHAQGEADGEGEVDGAGIGVPHKDNDKDTTSPAGKKRATKASRSTVGSDVTLNPVEESYFVKPVVQGQGREVTGIATSPRVVSKPEKKVPGSAASRDGSAVQMIVVVGTSGCIQLYSSATHALVHTRTLTVTVEKTISDPSGRTDSVYGTLRKKKIHVTEPVPLLCVAWSPDGRVIAVGGGDGKVRFLNAGTLEDVVEFEVGKDAVEKVAFSDDGGHAACADASFAVGYFRAGWLDRKGKDGKEGNEGKDSWSWLGKARPHHGKVVSLLFAREGEEVLEGHKHSMFPRLISVSADRHAAEYDLAASSEAGGLKIVSLTSLTQISSPLCAILPPPVHLIPPTSTALAAGVTPAPPISPNPWILVSDSQFKLKVYSAESFMCRRTVLGPAFGGAVSEMVVVPGDQGGEEYLAWRSDEKLVGLLKLPLDGNPHRVLATVAHPGLVTCMAVLTSPPALLTGGGPDGIVYKWHLTTPVLDAQITASGTGHEPFLRMLDPLARDGPVFKQVEDLFYYAQIRAAGEDYSKGARPVGDTIPLEQLPGVMAALGYYQTEREQEEMVAEVRMGDVESTGKMVTEIGMEDVVRLYLNHRPLVDITQQEVEGALAATHALDRMGGEAVESRAGGGTTTATTFLKSSMIQMLQQHGEPMQRSEFDNLVSSLIGSNPGLIPPRYVLPPPLPTMAMSGRGKGGMEAQVRYALPEGMTAGEFVGDVLGMGVVEEGGVEVEEEGEAVAVAVGEGEGEV